MEAVAVILAGGSGQRFSKNKIKQLVEVKGEPLLSYTIKKFQASSYIDEICIVANKSIIEEVKSMVQKHNFDKVCHIIEGGKTRSLSTYSALAIYKEEKKILIHDGVRPLISQQVIASCVKALDQYEACAVATKTTDTIFETNDSKIKNIPNRNHLYNAQTPQCFLLSKLKKAYQKAMLLEDNNFSDDCSLLMKYEPNIDIHIIEGNKENIKLTFPADIVHFEELL
ncbi:MAG: 2-C-methyl-D-erythritol 4-phosphate cytidylyltransferase [Treponema sp.]